MLLLVRKHYIDEIRAGRKTFEIRVGSRYRRIKAGGEISINGFFRVKVERVETFLSRKEFAAAYPRQAVDLDACYRAAANPQAGLFGHQKEAVYVFHFEPPKKG